LYNPLTADFIEITKELSATMLYLAEKGDMENCRKQVEEAISGGAALKKLAEMIEAQGGGRDGGLMSTSSCAETVDAPRSGYISHMNAEGVGTAAMMLGAGREKPEDKINYYAGITLHAKTGMFVQAGQKIATLKASDPNLFPAASDKFFESITFSQEKPENLPLIYERIGF
jgi:pyrimidine-nucleoside phosphorylase